MRTHTKAPTRTPKQLAPKLHAEEVPTPSRKRVRAGVLYPLDDHWVDKGDRPFVPTAKYPMRLQHRKRPDFLTLSPSETGLWLTAFGWPLTADKSRRLSDAEVEEMAARERSKLTSTIVTNLLTTRVRLARAYANVDTKRDLATQHRLIMEAYNEAVSAMTVAYTKQSREHVARSKKGAAKSLEKRQSKSKVWHGQARAQMDLSKTARSAHAMTRWVWSTLMGNGTWKNDFPGEDAVRQFVTEELRSKKNANRTHSK